MNWLEKVAYGALAGMAATVIVGMWALIVVLIFCACTRVLKCEGFIQQREVESACIDSESGEQSTERDCYQQ